MNASGSAPSSSHNDDGLARMNRRHRSPASHPLGFPLLQLFDKRPIDNNAIAHVPRRTELPRTSKYDGIFSQVFEAWKGGERELTNSLAAVLHKGTQFESKPGSVGETNVEGNYGIADILLLSTTNETNSLSCEFTNESGKTKSKPNKKPKSGISQQKVDAIAVIEVGLHSKRWLGKVGQGSMYLDMMTNEVSDYNFDRPILLVVITITATEAHKYKEGYIGVFLCWHNNPDLPSKQGVCMTLLHRRMIQTLRGFSECFGMVVYAAENLERWLREDASLARWRTSMPVEWQDEKNKYEYKYLGPNCCRVQRNGGAVSLSLFYCYY